MRAILGIAKEKTAYRSSSTLPPREPMGDEEQHPPGDNPSGISQTVWRETLTEFAETFARQVVAELRRPIAGAQYPPTAQLSCLSGDPSENPEETGPPTNTLTGGEFRTP